MHPVLDVGTFFRFLTGHLAFAAGKNLGEDIAKAPAKSASVPTRLGCAVIIIGKVETGEVDPRGR
jgi:hypothetical protein